VIPAIGARKTGDLTSKVPIFINNFKKLRDKKFGVNPFYWLIDKNKIKSSVKNTKLDDLMRRIYLLGWNFFTNSIILIR
jgi:hypothetical protein